MHSPISTVIILNPQPRVTNPCLTRHRSRMETLSKARKKPRAAGNPAAPLTMHASADPMYGSDPSRPSHSLPMHTHGRTSPVSRRLTARAPANRSNVRAQQRGMMQRGRIQPAHAVRAVARRNGWVSARTHARGGRWWRGGVNRRCPKARARGKGEKKAETREHQLASVRRCHGHGHYRGHYVAHLRLPPPPIRYIYFYCCCEISALASIAWHARWRHPVVMLQACVIACFPCLQQSIIVCPSRFTHKYAPGVGLQLICHRVRREFAHRVEFSCLKVKRI